MKSLLKTFFILIIIKLSLVSSVASKLIKFIHCNRLQLKWLTFRQLLLIEFASRLIITSTQDGTAATLDLNQHCQIAKCIVYSTS